jgi:diaminohydroxyphosphoribosylaminopyrimidine deaminase/5-amino-6-(5-phosphoribosylamino)uracil reductase
MNDRDSHHLAHALALAHDAIGLTEPNPRVGCVLADAQGVEIGSGHTQAAGDAHAEVIALRSAQAASRDLRGASAYVSLEPCSHHGRTPPCCDALIAAGVARVVVGAVDPNPLVAGQGIERLRAAGIEVVLAREEVAAQVRELNIGFFSRMQRGRPWVRMKIAASLDGRTALGNGVSQWITGEAARADGHAWRKRAGAVLTGIGTVLEDNPRLDVRLVSTPRQPLRVLVDSRLQLPDGARIAQPPGTLLVYAAGDAPRESALKLRGIEVVHLPDANGKVDLEAMLRDLGARGVNELHVEAGHKLNASLLKTGMVDELLVYLAPLLLGDGRDMAALGPFSQLTEGLRYEFHDVRRVDADLRVLARPKP